MKFKTLIPLAVMGVSVALSGCSSDAEKKLEGDRLSLYDFEKTLRQDSNTKFGMDGTEEMTTITLPEDMEGGVDEALTLPDAWENNFWPQVGGYANHAMKHVAFTEAQPRKLWARSIGKGASTRTPLTASPIVADGRVYTLDTQAHVQATDARTGDVLWAQNVLKSGEDEAVIGGGVAYSGNILYVTNGFNELVALNPENGSVLWRAATQDPVRGAPAAVPGRVFVTTMSNRTLAFDAANGTLLWQHTGLAGDTSVLGASTPAVDRDVVIAAYTSGEVYALRIENGQELWGESLAPIARAAGLSMLSDIRALPIIDGNAVYATSQANRVAAIDARAGMPVWQAAVGSSTTPWISGNRLYMVATQDTLLSMDRATGRIMWQTTLPKFEDPEDKEDPITWQGPVLAGGRLMVFASTGEVRTINPVDGTMVRTWDAGDALSLAPAFAGGVMYLVDDSGVLSAWK